MLVKSGVPVFFDKTKGTEKEQASLGFVNMADAVEELSKIQDCGTIDMSKIANQNDEKRVKQLKRRKL